MASSKLHYNKDGETDTIWVYYFSTSVKDMVRSAGTDRYRLKKNLL